MVTDVVVREIGGWRRMTVQRSFDGQARKASFRRLSPPLASAPAYARIVIQDFLSQMGQKIAESFRNFRRECRSPICNPLSAQQLGANNAVRQN
jgi:hypothetical protein